MIKYKYELINKIHNHIMNGYEWSPKYLKHHYLSHNNYIHIRYKFAKRYIKKEHFKIVYDFPYERKIPLYYYLECLNIEELEQIMFTNVL